MGFFEKIKNGLARTRQSMAISMNNLFASFTGENEEFFDDLEETLILADAGVDTATEAVERLREVTKERGLRGGDEVQAAFVEIMADYLRFDEMDLHLTTKPSVILMVGVNGVGKTTTIGKLARRYTDAGKKVLLAAADTFRAAAAEQLTVWADRAGVDIVRQTEGADPAAVVFDALAAAKARNIDVVLVDTAGRLQNKVNLMKELEKISRVIDKALPGADRETLLVLDGTTGQNALSQAKAFSETAGITGIVLTKLDGTAKGGVVISISHTMGIPVKYIGIGEKIDDLVPFDPADFVRALF